MCPSAVNLIIGKHFCLYETIIQPVYQLENQYTLYPQNLSSSNVSDSVL